MYQENIKVFFYSQNNAILETLTQRNLVPSCEKLYLPIPASFLSCTESKIRFLPCSLHYYLYHCCVWQTGSWAGVAVCSDLDRFRDFNCNLALMRAKILPVTAISNLEKQNDHTAEHLNVDNHLCLINLVINEEALRVVKTHLRVI